MDNQTAQTPKGKRKQSLDNIASVVTNKRSRSLVFLVTTFVLILLANGLLPLISGQAHYTAEIQEVTYGQFIALDRQDPLVDLTYGSKVMITAYKELYQLKNPDLTPEEITLLEPPNDMKVNVYTKFFFESPWWYFDTGLSLISAVFLFYAVFNYLIVRSKDVRIEHINGEYTIKQLNEKYLDPDTFEPWIELSFNKERKIKQHIRNIKQQLKDLEVKTPYTIRRRFKKHFLNLQDVDETNLLPVLYVKMNKKERQYINKKEELLSQLDETYIEESVVDNKVPNFREIRAGFVYSGVNHEGVGQDEYSAILTDKERIRGSILSKVLLSLSTTLGFASILTVLSVNVTSQAPLWIFLTILTKLVPLFLQVYFAIDYNNWFMENQLLPNLKARENIAMRYLAEMRRQGILTEPVVLQKVELPNSEKGQG